MRQIAREADITPAAIYNHYPSKDRLFTTLLQNAAPYDKLFALFSKIEAGSPEDMVRQMFRAALGLMAEHQDYLQLALIDAQERDGAALATFLPECCPGRRDGISGWWCWMPRPASARRAARDCVISPSRYFFRR